MAISLITSATSSHLSAKFSIPSMISFNIKHKLIVFDSSHQTKNSGITVSTLKSSIFSSRFSTLLEA